jgi:hypothetical protein
LLALTWSTPLTSPLCTPKSCRLSQRDATLPPKSRTQKTDGAIATNLSSRRATDATPCAPVAAPPDNSRHSSRCKRIPFQ